MAKKDELDDFLRLVASAPARSLDDAAPPRELLSGPPTLDGARPPLMPATFELPRVDPALYEILGEHARGGNGRIVLARDRRLGRRVAIKELLSGTDEGRARFIREALVTAALQHPAVVPVYEVGQWSSGAPTPFYAMKLVAGDSLAALTVGDAGRTRLDLLPALLTATRGVAFAHARRVVHRDLKPSNILVGEHGDAYVIDWGLAKVLDGAVTTAPAAGRTLPGDVLGTPGFMAPEQAAGEAVDARADVYALGLVLAQLLGAPSPRAGEPPLPAVRRLRAPRELVAACERALAPAPRERHADAGELARELDSFVVARLQAPSPSRGWFGR